MHKLVIVAGALAGSLFAQTTQVIPADFATTEAGSSTAWPFGLGSACRIQYLYGAGETGLNAPVTIRSLNLRANGGAANVAKNNIDLEISLSTTSVTVGTASTTFANNHGPNLTVAYVRKMTSVQATMATTPGQYTGPLMLDVPFPYDPAAGNLLIDYDIASQPAGTWTHDTPFTTAGTHTAVGTSCGGLSASSTGGVLGGSLTLSMSGGVANNPAVLLVGTTVLPTPVPVPGSPGCFLYQDFPVTIPMPLSATGAASLPLSVPPLSFYRGAVILSQWGAANASLGIETTQTRQSTLASWVVLRVHNTSSNTSPTGTVQNYVGIVTELGL
ncbi:MAG TPA: hypothetical protein VK081_14170 [Planctomycetota bacterium]|nr:hypothetical protein [Planctomycetota bacterium]